LKILFTSYNKSDVEAAMAFAKDSMSSEVLYEQLLNFNIIDFECLVIVVDSMDKYPLELLKKIKVKNLQKKVILAFKEKSEIQRTSFTSDLCFNLKVESFFDLNEAEEFFKRFKNQVLSSQSPVFDDSNAGVSDEVLSKALDELEDVEENYESLKHLERFIESYYPSQKLLFDHFILDYQVSKFSKKEINNIKRLSENIYLNLKKDVEVSKLLTEIYARYPETLSHTFLSSVLAAVIAQNLDWAEKKTVELVVKGALLHNIGYLDIDDSLDIDVLDRESLCGPELYEFQNYPMYGYNALKDTSIGLQVKQIIFQHQEYLDGSGYPNGLSGMNIFPLARIVCFASDFARLIAKDHLSPALGVKKLISSRELLLKYESSCVKAFIKGMIS
jgi:HD-GYP domain-containing protein (c-di-GMP phosphodiesterase class II)